jgi:thiosulfate/3-mercaptopyruvate sulfurtransferase
MRNWSCTAVAVVAGASVACAETEERAPLDRLVSTQWLAERLDEPGLVVIDARPTEPYLDRHLPGAVSASFSAEQYLSYGRDVSYGGGLDLFGDHEGSIPFQDGPPAKIEDAARELGIDDDSVVVAYDAGADFLAARLFFTLHSHGLADVRLLDGGFRKWEAEGRPVTDEVPLVERGGFVVREQDETMVVDTDEVLATIDDESTKLLSGLLPSWHYGGFRAYSEAGHIPSTVNVPLGQFFNTDATWRDPEAIRSLFEVMGVDEDDDLIVYCGGNPLAACNYFTLRFVAGYDQVRSYVGSMVSWLADPRSLPLNTYNHPELLRDTEWIHWWAGERIQGLLQDAPALVVDVRPAPTYEEAHIPWSINIALPNGDEVTESRVEAWGERLGAVGIGEGTEAVVCDDGVTPRAASLFWLLEYLGHSTVSVCAEGIAGWAREHELTDNPTVIADPTQPLDVAIHPKAFEVDVDETRILRSVADARIDARFPRQWVVVGEIVPANLPAETHAHVPAAAHLTEDGFVRPAYELWTLYEEAGVSKFSEVILAADSVADASIGYLALRLLDFPMVRVWVPDGELVR